MNTQTETVAPIAHPTPAVEVVERVILYGVSWETYERLLADFEESNAVRFTYDQGVLEIMSPSIPHEKPNRTLALLVEVLAEELHIDVVRLGSTTFKRADLRKGFEPDSCFYIQHEKQMRGRQKIDLTKDPPPDLLIEVDITSPSLNKLPIYARIGVPEVWRYDGSMVHILRLEDRQYEEVKRSLALPPLTSAVATRFLHESRELRSTVWLRRVRAWARRLHALSKSFKK